uniref:Uncharacterized protein n=1 Tax=Anguilla anguilla TaxID=7936 RepID=A0A0E9PQT7_ANGAN
MMSMSFAILLRLLSRKRPLVLVDRYSCLISQHCILSFLSVLTDSGEVGEVSAVRVTVVLSTRKLFSRRYWHLEATLTRNHFPLILVRSRSTTAGILSIGFSLVVYAHGF